MVVVAHRPESLDGVRRVLELQAELRHEYRAIALTTAVVTVSLLALSTLTVLPAFALGRAVVLGEVPAPWFWAAMAGLVLTRALLTWSEMDLSHSVAYRVLARLRIALFDRYAVALPSRRRENTGDAAATALTDTEKLEFFYAHTVAQLFAAAVVCLTGLTLLTVAYPPLAVVALVCLAGVGGTAVIGRRRLHDLGVLATEQTGALSSHVVDVLGGLREVLGYGLAARVGADVAARGADAARTAGRIETTQRVLAALRETGVTVAVVAVLTVAAFGGVAPEHLAGLVTMALATIAAAADAATTLTQLRPIEASAARVRDELTRPAVVVPAERPRPLSDGPLALSFRDVTFGYGGTVVLDRFCLDVAPGERVGVRGPSGAGKSTLVALAGRLWDPDDGVVALTGGGGTGAVDGSPGAPGRAEVGLTELADAELRGAVGVVEQDGRLFSGTVAENLLRGTGASEAELHRVLEALGLRGVVGPDDGVGEGGLRLSGGQHSRLRLARAALRRPRVLVVNEPTADLDADSAHRVHELLASLSCTLLVVSHQERTLAGMDRVIDLNRTPVTAEAR
ncbi:ABC transporter ATP-binding protein [Myceligenerans halotolerans]